MLKRDIFDKRFNRMKYLIQPVVDDPGDEYPLNMMYTTILDRIHFVLLEPDVRKSFLQEWRDFLLKGYDLNPYFDETSLRGNLGVASDEALPRLPRLSSYEVTILIPDARLYLLYVIGQMEKIENTMSEGSRLDKNPVAMEDSLWLDRHRTHPNCSPDSPKLTGNNPDQAELQMSVYEEYQPFVHQAYQKYKKDYNTPEKQRRLSFSEFFMSLPEVLSLFQTVGEEKLYFPYDEKKCLCRAVQEVQ